MTRIDLKGLSSHEIDAWVAGQGLEAYRGRQIMEWLFKRLARSFDEMTDLPKSLRATLEEKANIRHLEEVKVDLSKDGTRKYLFKLSDGFFIESVLIPEKDHYTLCLSSQVGCAMACRFCLTATQGLKRNLKASEIIEQVIQIKRSINDPGRLTNIVLMGMGEPLANYDAVIKAARNLISERGMNFSHRKVTLSTCGLVPQMRKMGQEITVNLAVSLNAADDKTRDFLMPINKKYPLERLLSACRDFPLPNRRMITFEYVLIEGVNDHPQQALKVAKILSGLRAKINLIPLNPHTGLNMSPPSMDKIIHFQEVLLRNNFTPIIRKSKGTDIQAACGQLSGEYTKVQEALAKKAQTNQKLN
jgi:23S rRNA (adenine2503-C2)-methyltransferase